MREVSASLFFFSSRRRHTRLVSDWSSDVCSSDLSPWACSTRTPQFVFACCTRASQRLWTVVGGQPGLNNHCSAGKLSSRLRQQDRSEERRVGKECRSRWSPYH